MDLQKLIDPYNAIIKKSIVALFFLSYLIIGLCIYKDYGMSWDETFNLQNGIVSYNYIFHNDNTLLTYKDRDYGVAFELVLLAIQKLFNYEELRDIYFLRHLCTFLLFYVSVCFFYLLSKNYFKDWFIALLSCLLLILSPRIFAHSFFNSKDIAFLSVFIISTFTAIQFLNNRSILTIVLHSLSSAILIDIRILGVFIPLVTILFLVCDPHSDRKNIYLTIIVNVFCYAFLTWLLTVLFWPYLWTDPVANFITAFLNMKQFRWNAPVLYFGQMIPASELPWHYIPVWILISTPLLHIILFFFGLFASARILMQYRTTPNTRHARDTLIFLIWFFSPIIAVIVLNSVVYDSWRHLFFVYPALIIISMKGLMFISQAKNYATSLPVKSIILSILILIIAIGLFDPLYLMIRQHPYQNIYFNPIAGRNMSEIKRKFELDYWGLSYRQALEYIVNNDPSQKIKLLVNEASGKYAQKILPAKSADRIEYVDNLGQAKYLISTFRGHPEEYPFKNEIFAIKIGGAKIIVAYRLH